MPRKEYVLIHYPGSCISVNHYLGRRKDGGYYVKQEVKDWKEEFRWLLKRLHLEDWQLPLEVTCSGWFKSERDAPDLSNLSKVINDSIEELTGINDREFRWRDGTRTIDKNCDPNLLISIQEGVLNVPLDNAGCPTEPLKAKISSKGRRRVK